jgi:hypothetical protein
VDRLTRERIERWRTSAVSCIWPSLTSHDLERLCDLALSQEAVRDEALEALEEGYAVLADVTNQWEGRHTIAGQKLLCKMRDAIASATGISGEFVQDNATNPLKREPNAAAQASGECASERPAAVQLGDEEERPKAGSTPASPAAAAPSEATWVCPVTGYICNGTHCGPRSCQMQIVGSAPAAPDVASVVKHDWVERADDHGVYDCVNCTSWTANLPLYKDEVCDAKERRFTDRRKARSLR